MTDDLGRVLTDRALICDEAPAGLHPTGFDPSREAPADDAEVPAAALPMHIGRLHLGERRSNGERLCSHSHEVPAGHPLYWPERMGEYPDDMDPLCLAHAIEQAESDNGWCATCAAAEFEPADDAETQEWLRGDWYEKWQDATENADEGLMATLVALRGRVDRTILAALAARPSAGGGSRDSDTHPQGGDAHAAPFMGSAGPKDIAR